MQRPTSTVSEAPSRHTALVRAGWGVLDDLPLPRVLAGATTAAVSARAGVTTGSFFHHFPSAAAFADQLVLSLLETAPDPDAAFGEFVGSLDHLGLTEVVRQSVLLTWHVYTTDADRLDHQRHVMHLWPHLDAELGEPVDDLRTVADVLRRVHVTAEGDGRLLWHEVLRRSGRVMVEPFTVDRVVVGLGALFQGLLLRHAVDPDLVDDQLFADLATVLIATLTQPVGAGRRVADISRFDPSVEEAEPASPQARAGAARRRTTRRRIVAGATGMFADGWQEITAADVASRSGVSTQTVLNAFGSVQGVAAATFARHSAELAALAGDPGRPTDRLRQVLERLAGLAGLEPGAARALLDARLAPHHGEATTSSVDELVAVDDVLFALVEHLAGDDDPHELAAALVDLTLRQGIAGTSPEEAAALALRLLTAPAGAAPALDSDASTTPR